VYTAALGYHASFIKWKYVVESAVKSWQKASLFVYQLNALGAV
jgi:hypothetical protein